MKTNKAKVVFKALTTSFSFLLAVLLTGNAIINENAQTINGFLNETTNIMIEDENAENEDTTYYKTKFKSVKEEKENGMKLCEDVVSEGAVLLENKNNALPLTGEKPKVSLFSVSSVDMAIGGGGSGANGGASKIDFKTALEEEGFEVNSSLWDWYNANKGTYGRVSNNGVGVEYTIGDAGWDKLPSSKDDNADVAVFVLTRLGSESVDIRYNTGDKKDMTNGNYLELSPNEISVISNISSRTGEGKQFKHFLVIMNTTNQVECDFVSDYNIDSLIWCGTVGTSGTRSLAKIMRGTVNPSGRLSDAFWNEHRFNPVYANWGTFFYSLPGGGDSSKITQDGIGGSCSPYVVYQEGIYNGYRYAETRYEDKLLQRANVDDASYTYDYYEAIAYPFGYGLSYTTFSYSDFALKEYNEQKDQYIFNVKVTNTGDVKGKETVQLYIQKPYTTYDIENNIEKSSVELVAFNKTKILDGGASEVVELVVDGKYFASYDSYKAKTYVVDEGDYYFTVAKDSHDAINNILKKKNSSVSTSFKGNTTEGNSNFVATIHKDFDAEKYSTSVTGKEITNQFDNADLKLYSPENKDAVTYISRNNWAGTTKFGFDENMNQLDNQVKLVWTDKIAEEMTDVITAPEKSDVPYPTYGSTKTNYSLINLRVDENGNKIPFDDQRWEDLLDQLTFEDMASLLSCGVRMTKGISSINKPTTIDHNGGVGVNQSYSNNSGFNRGFAVSNNDPDRNTTPSAYPANAVVAATFNEELIEEYGRAWGEDCLWAGYSGLYGPGVNQHRGAYGGRTFEYYSEDSFLGGKICAALCKGLVEKGIYVYLKHAILNEQEGNRLYVATWANEQTIRELYLRQFELAISEGGAQCVMSGYNKIGAIWTGKQGFINNVLHDEFGMSGFAVTDFVLDPHWQRLAIGALNGNALVDRDFSGYPVFDICKPGTTGYGHVAQAMRLEVHRILYTVVHSAAMNGISSSTKIIELQANWKYVINSAKTSVITLFAGSALLLTWCYVYDFIEKKYIKKPLENGGKK